MDYLTLVQLKQRSSFTKKRKSLSWEISSGVDRITKNQKLQWRNELGFGISKGKKYGLSLIGLGGFESNLSNFYTYISPKVSVWAYGLKSLKLGLHFQRRFYQSSELKNFDLYGFYMTYLYSSKLEFSASLKNYESQNFGKIEISYHF